MLAACVDSMPSGGNLFCWKFKVNSRAPLVVLYGIEGTVVKGPLQPLVDVIIYARGLYAETLVKIWRSLIHILSV